MFTNDQQMLFFLAPRRPRKKDSLSGPSPNEIFLRSVLHCTCHCPHILDSCEGLNYNYFLQTASGCSLPCGTLIPKSLSYSDWQVSPGQAKPQHLLTALIFSFSRSLKALEIFLTVFLAQLCFEKYVLYIIFHFSYFVVGFLAIQYNTFRNKVFLIVLKLFRNQIVFDLPCNPGGKLPSKQYPISSNQFLIDRMNKIP